jgi:hypothetical protein
VQRDQPEKFSSSLIVSTAITTTLMPTPDHEQAHAHQEQKAIELDLHRPMENETSRSSPMSSTLAPICRARTGG